MLLHPRQIAALGILVGALGWLLSVAPPVQRFEEGFGLGALFGARGPIRPPDDAVVVSIAGDSAARLGLTTHVDRWPRALHGQLLERLNAAGAKVVAFDIIFDTRRAPDGDRAFAQALRAAGNAVLVEKVTDDSVAKGRGLIERRFPPIPPFRQAALGTAPFMLPTVPVRVSQFWTFGRAGSDTPTLPVVVLQAYARSALPKLFALLRRVRPGRKQAWDALERADQASGGLEATVRGLRDAFRADPALGDDLLRALDGSHDADVRLVRALIGVYAGTDSRYLWLYGPARTIRTVPYYEALAALSPREMTRIFRGKAVFVGFSESKESQQKDKFFSVFSQRTGQDLSGVEIGATAFANLLDRRAVRPLPLSLAWTTVFAWGLIVAALASAPPALIALPAALAAGAVYAVGAGFAFSRYGWWPPLAVPLVIQLPVALFAGLLCNHRALQRQRERIEAVVGYHLPRRALDSLARETAGAAASKETVYGTCLVSDAEGYAGRAERLEPEELARFMDEYYRALIEAVETHGGTVADFGGDSMVAVWVAAKNGESGAAEAAAAALAVVASVERQQLLPTRVGLGSGKLLLGSIGSEARGEYRAVGDIVNVAARLESLNRHLGTRVLMTAATAAAVTRHATRPLGRFLLVGKTVPVAVHELLPAGPYAAHRLPDLQAFGRAVALFEQGRWDDAAREFEALLRDCPADGPSRFYLERARALRARPPDNWTGVVRMNVK